MHKRKFGLASWDEDGDNMTGVGRVTAGVGWRRGQKYGDTVGMWTK